MNEWFHVANADDVESPSLLVYPERIRENIRRMVRLAGGAARLCPHVKTHKLAEVVRLQLAEGVTRFKCATLAEAGMVAGCGAADILVAYPPVGPNLRRFLDLMAGFPRTVWSVLADDEGTIRELAAACQAARVTAAVLLDLDVGMHRTGIAPGERAFELYQLITGLPGLRPGGLHAYDGHLHEREVAARARACEEAFAPVGRLRARLIEAGLPVPRVVAGGTPTFPMHARRDGVDCSPGTCVLWDAGYSEALPDLDFLVAAVVLTRVVSRPGPARLCLDLGHKAVASEMPPPRVRFPELPDARAVMHSEEHLVIETRVGADLPVGAVVYGIPWHICPTVALHSEVVVVEDARATRRWTVARDRRFRRCC